MFQLRVQGVGGEKSRLELEKESITGKHTMVQLVVQIAAWRLYLSRRTLRLYGPAAAWLPTSCNESCEISFEVCTAQGTGGRQQSWLHIWQCAASEACR